MPFVDIFYLYVSVGSGVRYCQSQSNTEKARPSPRVTL